MSSSPVQDDLETDGAIVEDESDRQPNTGEPISAFDIISSPNDFNIKTLISFIDKGIFIVPGFQRNYVWDIGRASRLVESVVLGLPVPQVFLYEESRNRLLVIDGQQRLMSLYYYAKKRFPRKDVRPTLRGLIDQAGGKVPEKVLEDDRYFQRFNLHLPSKLPDDKNPLHGKNYSTLGDKADTFDFQTIRSIVIKQLSPDGHDSVFEIFNRLNSGGTNLRPQEMRSSLFHSPFFETLHRLNALPAWRALVGVPNPDARMKDSEVLLRAAAMLVAGSTYKPSMVRFLNQFSKDSCRIDDGEVSLRDALFRAFFERTAHLGASAFNLQSPKLSVPLFEAIFSAACIEAYRLRDPSKVVAPDHVAIDSLKNNSEFIASISSNSADTSNVATRLKLARAAIVTS